MEPPKYTIRDLYEYYTRYTSQYPGRKITFEQYQQIIEKANSIIMDKMINENKDFVLPFRMGVLRVRKEKFDFKNKKTRENFVDIRESKKVSALKGRKTVIYDLHEETNGYRAFFDWHKGKQINADLYDIHISDWNNDELQRKFRAREIDVKPL